MKKLVIGLTIAVAFLTGCLTAMVATKLVVPPAHAGTNPQKWEYYCTDEGIRLDEKIITESFNRVGKEGWELASVASATIYENFLTEAMFCFKRPLL